ncbi:MAG: carboxylesterase family protein [Pseudomonadaceae bacterium]|nr:carboxylesterase family protein [Pseudomonadaceae bacterium]
MDGLRRKLGTRLGDGFDEVVAAYSASRGTDDPWQLYIAIQGNDFQQGTNFVASMHSDAAPVFLYSFDYPVTRMMGACHGAKIASVYANATEATGSKPEAAIVEEAVCRAWIAFAHTGNPNHAGLPHWP